MAEAKVAIVTGAAGGLGAEIAGRLSTRAAPMCWLRTSTKRLCATAPQKRKSRGEIVAHPADITKPDAVKEPDSGGDRPLGEARRAVEQRGN